MSSYYRTINGIQYDRAMLDTADSLINKKRDSIISLADAKKIIAKASDAGTITDVEARTLNYIFEHYKFTKTAEDYFSNFANLEKSEHISAENETGILDDDIFGFKEFMVKYYIYFILVALVIFLVYLYSDRIAALFTGKAGVDSKVMEEQTSESIQKRFSKEKTVTVTAGENEYIVKEKDTLFDISSHLYGDPSRWKELYEMNKETIQDPSMIYPGQKLKTDIKR